MAGLKLDVARRDGVAVVTLDHAPVNALGTQLIAALHRTLDDVLKANDVGVLHFKSALKVFSAGANLAEMRANLANPERVDAQIDAVRDIQNVLKRIETFPVATLAEVGGAALGGGFELALACDLRVAANEAKLGLPETKLGLIPGAGGTQRLTRLCGKAVASRLILGAEVLDGQAARELGLVQWSVPRAELSAFADAQASRLSALPRSALREAKHCIASYFDPGRNGYEEELISTRRLLGEDETRKLVAAFLDSGK